MDLADGAGGQVDVGTFALPLNSGPTLPFKLNQDRRQHIPRQKHRVTNSAAYDARLRQRGSLTVWFTDEAIEGWRAEPRTTPGGQPLSASLTSLRGIAARWYSPLAILTALTLRAVFRLALRQTEGLIGSIIGLLRLALAVPDHSTLSRRAKTLQVPRPQLRPMQHAEVKLKRPGPAMNGLKPLQVRWRGQPNLVHAVSIRTRTSCHGPSAFHLSTISTRRFCGSRTPSAVCTRGRLSPKP